MGFDELACASCGGPVSEGRCSTCRGTREMFRHRLSAATRQILWQVLIALAVLFAALAIAVERTG